MSTSGSGKVIGAPSDLDPCPVDEIRFSIGVIIDLPHIPRLGSWLGPALHDTPCGLIEWASRWKPPSAATKL
jgi:hypothetical protein